MKHAKGPWKFGGRASKEVYVPETGRHICTVHFAALQAMTNINFNEVSLVNAELIALAPTAPHDCADPDCPGAVNKRKLEAFPEMLEALEAAEQHYAMLCEVICIDNPPPGGHPVLLRLRAVLAKVKGE